MRMALEREALYASEYPFIEYGLDLTMMAELEKGVKRTRLTDTDYDANPPKETKEYVHNYLSKMKSKKMDRIPLRLAGKGHSAYLLQDWIIHRGVGALRVNNYFKEIARHYNTKDEFMIKDRYRKRMEAGGIRYAACVGTKWRGH